MKLQIRHNIPFIKITVSYQGKIIDIPKVLIDTGSGRTILSADMLISVSIIPLPEDIPYTVRGIGGTEIVYTRRVDYLQAGNFRISDFEIEIGGMDYGFDINGIIGTDFLIPAGAIINLKEMKIGFKE